LRAAPAQIPACWTTALGSYLGCVAAKRACGNGYTVRVEGIHRAAMRIIRAQVIRVRWLRCATPCASAVSPGCGRHSPPHRCCRAPRNRPGPGVPRRPATVPWSGMGSHRRCLVSALTSACARFESVFRLPHTRPNCAPWRSARMVVQTRENERSVAVTRQLRVRAQDRWPTAWLIQQSADGLRVIEPGVCGGVVGRLRWVL